ncbi:kinase-like domain-containing protein [Mycena belliarum]|uniref:Kinase-like domain-containing protein n=1 Tax=Mycena belliarum TaxID=1033014 RepID=A0AAD6U5I1_9AGAR|nr:kinase-like domain-containing protein [Mycena belliae]
MQQAHRPLFHRGFASSSQGPVATPTNLAPTGATQPGTMHVKRVTLTSKKNWWMVEMDEEEAADLGPFSSEETAVDNIDSLYNYDHHPSDVHHSEQKARMPPTPATSQPIYAPPRHPNSLFSFPTPLAYTAPKGSSNPTASLSPCAHGSASELFKCIVKKPDVVQLEINGEMQSNASDVTVQFLAELRVYTTLSRHRNVCAFLGSLENVGMVLEYIDGRTLYDVVIARPPLSAPQKREYHNQLMDGLTHLHSYGLSHGDLSLLNVQVTTGSDTVKLLDFGRSVSADSELISPHDAPADPFTMTAPAARQTEQIHPGTRPFSAPEVLRGECTDARLADAYSFGMILVCLDRCECVDVKPWDQRKDLLPADLFDGCEIFEERAREYLRKWDAGRRRLKKEDMLEVGT